MTRGPSKKLTTSSTAPATGTTKKDKKPVAEPTRRSQRQVSKPPDLPTAVTQPGIGFARNGAPDYQPHRYWRYEPVHEDGPNDSGPVPTENPPDIRPRRARPPSPAHSPTPSLGDLEEDTGPPKEPLFLPAPDSPSATTAPPASSSGGPSTSAEGAIASKPGARGLKNAAVELPAPTQQPDKSRRTRKAASAAPPAPKKLTARGRSAAPAALSAAGAQPGRPALADGDAPPPPALEPSVAPASTAGAHAQAAPPPPALEPSVAPASAAGARPGHHALAQGAPPPPPPALEPSVAPASAAGAHAQAAPAPPPPAFEPSSAPASAAGAQPGHHAQGAPPPPPPALQPPPPPPALEPSVAPASAAPVSAAGAQPAGAAQGEAPPTPGQQALPPTQSGPAAAAAPAATPAAAAPASVPPLPAPKKGPAPPATARSRAPPSSGGAAEGARETRKPTKIVFEEEDDTELAASFEELAKQYTEEARRDRDAAADAAADDTDTGATEDDVEDASGEPGASTGAGADPSNSSGASKKTKSKPGPVSKKARQRIDNLVANFKAGVSDIAKEIGKPERVVWGLTGLLEALGRRANLYNMFVRRWCLQNPAAKTEVFSAYVRRFVAAYHAEVTPLSDDEREELRGQLEKWLAVYDKEVAKEAVSRGEVYRAMLKMKVQMLELGERNRLLYNIVSFGGIACAVPGDLKGQAANCFWTSGADLEKIVTENRVELRKVLSYVGSWAMAKGAAGDVVAENKPTEDSVKRIVQGNVRKLLGPLVAVWQKEELKTSGTQVEWVDAPIRCLELKVCIHDWPNHLAIIEPNRNLIWATGMARQAYLFFDRLERGDPGVLRPRAVALPPLTLTYEKSTIPGDYERWLNTPLWKNVDGDVLLTVAEVLENDADQLADKKKAAAIKAAVAAAVAARSDAIAKQVRIITIKKRKKETDEEDDQKPAKKRKGGSSKGAAKSKAQLSDTDGDSGGDSKARGAGQSSTKSAAKRAAAKRAKAKSTAAAKRAAAKRAKAKGKQKAKAVDVEPESEDASPTDDDEDEDGPGTDDSSSSSDDDDDKDGDAAADYTESDEDGDGDDVEDDDEGTPPPSRKRAKSAKVEPRKRSKTESRKDGKAKTARGKARQGSVPFTAGRRHWQFGEYGSWEGQQLGGGAGGAEDMPFNPAMDHATERMLSVPPVDARRSTSPQPSQPGGVAGSSHASTSTNAAGAQAPSRAYTPNPAALMQQPATHQPVHYPPQAAQSLESAQRAQHLARRLELQAELERMDRQLNSNPMTMHPPAPPAQHTMHTHAPPSMRPPAPRAMQTPAPPSMHTHAPHAMQAPAPSAMHSHAPPSMQTHAPPSMQTHAPHAMQTHAPHAMQAPAPHAPHAQPSQSLAGQVLYPTGTAQTAVSQHGGTYGYNTPGIDAGGNPYAYGQSFAQGIDLTTGGGNGGDAFWDSVASNVPWQSMNNSGS